MQEVIGRRSISLATCVAVVAVPCLAVVATMSAIGGRDPLPGLSGNFESAPWVDWTCALGSAFVAGVFGWMLSRLGPHWELPRRQLASMTFAAWAGGFFLLSFGLCPMVNRVVGRVSFETGRVQGPVARKDCRHAVEVVGPTVPSGTRVCLDGTRSDRLQEGDGVPLVRVASDWGAQSGLAPEHGDRR